MSSGRPAIPNHRDVTRAEFQQITGLTDAQMNDEAAMRAANTKLTRSP